MTTETIVRLTHAQIKAILPPPINGKYRCPECEEYRLTLYVKNGVQHYDCKTPGNCDPTAKLWELVRQREGRVSKKKDSGPTLPGLTVDAYAEAKRLDAGWLEANHWAYDDEWTPGNIPVVVFPYFETAGDLPMEDEEPSEMPQRRYRYSMETKPRDLFGGHHVLYGLAQLQLFLAQANFLIEKGWLKKRDGTPAKIEVVFLAEGESCTQSLAYNRAPVLGVPGKNSWRPEWTSNPLFEGKTVLVVQEPDAPDFAQKIANSFPTGRVRSVKMPDGLKDVSDLWIDCVRLSLEDEESPPNTFFFDGQQEARAWFSERLQAAVQASVVVVPEGTPADEKAKAEQAKWEVETITLDTVTPRAIDWLWPNRLPLGKLVVFFGLPDRGKSSAAADIAALGSVGGEWPDCKNTHAPFETLILAAEDDLGDTWVPRLMACGADLSKIHAAEKMSLSDNATKQERAIALDMDIQAIERALAKHPGIRLVIVDPVSAYLGRLNRNKDTDMRPLLQRLKELAAKANVTLIAISHFNKNIEQASIHRISGAGAWGEVPRAIWAFVDVEREDGDKSDPEQDYFMLAAKLNITSAAGREGLRYGFKSAAVSLGDGKTATVGQIQWLGPAGNRTLDRVMEAKKGGPGPKPEKTQTAMKWLEEYLADGAKPAGDKKTLEEGTVLGDGSRAGFHHNTLYNAKKRLGNKIRSRPLMGAYQWEWVSM